MHPVGERLKQARTAKGLSLEQAVIATRIRKHYLEALERGDRAALPSPVQGRGFLRLYAGYLGLDGEELVAEWEGRPRPAPVSSPSVPPPPAPPPPRQPEPVEPASPPVEIEPQRPDEEDAPEETLPPPSATNSQAILVEIGATLRKQRERLGLSLDDVEKHTHIRRRYLIALETSRPDQLPSTVQSRGMLSNYATFLNLDAEALLLRYAEVLQNMRIERLASQAGPPPGGKTAPRGAKPASGLRRFFTPDLAFGAGLILVLFLFIIWTVSRISAAGTSPAQVTLPSVSDVLLASASPTMDPAVSVTPGPGESQPPTAAAGQASAETPQAPAGATPEIQTATLGAINSDPLQIYIIARERAFLRVSVDGEIRFNGRLIPGNAYPFSGVDRIDVIIGNAHAVQIFFNQQELPAESDAGVAASYSFTQTGIQTPTALPTPTATNTPEVTPTPTAGTPLPEPTITPFIP